jgi:ribosome production factor 2
MISSKPKNARAKRAMAKREPQQNENPKTTLFVTGQKTSQILKLAVADLSTLKRPFCERFTKKNDIHPFDDASCTSNLRQRRNSHNLHVIIDY